MGGVRPIFKIYRKREIQRRHSITLYCPVVRLSNQVIKDNHFVNLESMKHQKMRLIPNVSLNKLPVFNERRFETIHLSDDNEIFRRCTIMIELYNSLKFMNMFFFIQKVSMLNLCVAF